MHDLPLVAELSAQTTGRLPGARNHWWARVQAELRPLGLVLLAPLINLLGVRLRDGRAG